jgi:uncharacterized protein
MLESTVPSPCVKVCCMNPTTGWCDGCLRTRDEIAAWPRMDDTLKRGVWTLLDERRRALPSPPRVPPGPPPP